MSMGGGEHFQHTQISPIGGPPKAWTGPASEARQRDALFSWSLAQLSPHLLTLNGETHQTVFCVQDVARFRLYKHRFFTSKYAVFSIF